ncbi:MAG TPA: Dabb family protein [Blastocatellia bacterium]|nr:Dabb family protein [Blastocatellia bacterium]
MIKHIVFWKYKPESTADERKQALDALRELPGKIDVIREFEVGEDVLRAPRSWDAAIVATFDDLEALQVYTRHDDHVAAALKLQAIREAIGSVDYEY